MYLGCFGEQIEKENTVAITLAKGQAILLRGDLVHAGAKYETVNYACAATSSFRYIPADGCSWTVEFICLRFGKCFMVRDLERFNHHRFCGRKTESPSDKGFQCLQILMKVARLRICKLTNRQNAKELH